ncbi:hypothetical protein ACFO9Q_00130 [Paenibacillus sp. GCM10023252]|uniref:hypothetical protein n=1 Tax=Paenibacillus sp. GCM10023252 TaxID=3252649 RepID=UPI00360E6B31
MKPSTVLLTSRVRPIMKRPKCATASRVGKGRPQQQVSSAILRKVARTMLPFYQAIASRPAYAAKWSAAVVDADLDSMKKLLSEVSAELGRLAYGTNGIGYFITFGFRGSDYGYTNGTTIPPGTVQFKFQTNVHRRLARAVIPYYRALAYRPAYREAVVRSIRDGHSDHLERIVRSKVKSSALKSVQVESSGTALTFKYRSSKYAYRNLLFLEGVL